MGRRIGIFFAVTAMVLIVGMAAMLLYVEKLKSETKGENNADTGDKIEIVDFSADASGAHENNTAANSDGENAQIITDSYEETDVLMYNEVLSLGQKALLAECADKDRVTFAFAGDIMFDESYTIMNQYIIEGSNVNNAFLSGMLDKMRAADVFMINNEFPFSTRGEPLEGKQYTFRADPKHVGIYNEIGVDLVSLANNHAYDYGNDALLDTFDTLDGAGIPYVGAGRNIDEATNPVYVIANGMKIAIVSATQIERNLPTHTKEATPSSAGVLRCLDPSALLKVIEEAKENSDFVILYIHWGTEGSEEIDWLQRDQAIVYAKAGVDLIIGNHTHCLQQLDVVEGVPVVYSLGNFWFNSKAQDTCLIEASFNKDGIESMRFIPCRQENCRTTLLAGAEADRVLNYMRSISPNVEIDAEGYVTF